MTVDVATKFEIPIMKTKKTFDETKCIFVLTLVEPFGT